MMLGKIGTIKPGIYRNMRFADYLAEPAMSASRLKLLYKSHRDFVKGIRSTAAMGSGRIEHLAVLEREKWDKIVVVIPETRINEKDKEVRYVRSGAHWKQFQADNAGKLIITAKENEQCMEVAHEVYSNPDAKKCLIGEKEVSIFWDDPVFGPSKGRIDNLGNTFAADLKRTAKKLERFGFTCDDMGYDIQAAWYLRGISAVGLYKVDRFIFVAYESAWPHDSTCQEAYQGMIESGEDKIEVAADNLKAAEADKDGFHGKFPGLVGVDFPIDTEGW